MEVESKCTTSVKVSDIPELVQLPCQVIENISLGYYNLSVAQ